MFRAKPCAPRSPRPVGRTRGLSVWNVRNGTDLDLRLL